MDPPPPVAEPAPENAAEPVAEKRATNGVADAASPESPATAGEAPADPSISYVTSESKQQHAAQPNESGTTEKASVNAQESAADPPAEPKAEEPAPPVTADESQSAGKSLEARDESTPGTPGASNADDPPPPADANAQPPTQAVDASGDPPKDPPATEKAASPSPAPAPDVSDGGFDLDLPSSLEVYDMANYTFGKKDVDARGYLVRLDSPLGQSAHLRARYAERGQRRSVAGALLVHSHRFPLLLLLQRADGRGGYSLPGGRLRMGEGAEAGLARKLRRQLTPAGEAKRGAAAAEAEEEEEEEDAAEMDIGERLASWYRIDFSQRFYPYVPAHVTKPKEEMHVHMVSLPEKFAFSVPKNMQLVAVPLYEMFNNPDEFGNVIASLPTLLSRFHMNYC